MKTIELRPIKESTEDYEAVEERIKALFLRTIYLPLLRDLRLPRDTIENAADDALLKAIRSGRVTYERGAFRGKFNAEISRKLRKLEARWDRRRAAWVLPKSALPVEVKAAVSDAFVRFQERLDGIERQLAQILPDKIAGELSVSKLFESTLAKTNRDLEDSIRGITIAPKLTPEQKKRIADEWQNNMRIWIRDFTEKEIKTLRAKVKAVTFSGDRHESLVKTIQRSYQVSENKAKFLASQETSLLMTKFKETRYADAVVMEYKWVSVAGSKNHPVRPRHKALADASAKGKIFTWDDPPVTSEAGEPARRNNPGQDYNCRCFAVPVVTFRK